MAAGTELARIDVQDGEAGDSGRWEDPDGHIWSYALLWRPVGGHFECVSLQLQAPEGQAISAATLRRFPVGHLMENSRRMNEDFVRRVAEAMPRRRAELLTQATLWEESHASRSGPKGYGAEHFVEVATVYQREAMLGTKPTLAVAAHFVVSKSAAAKWVARARVMGLLPPARKGKAG